MTRPKGVVLVFVLFALGNALVHHKKAHAHKPHLSRDEALVMRTRMLEDLNRLDKNLAKVFGIPETTQSFEETTVTLDATLRAHYLDLATKAVAYHNKVAKTTTLDTRFALFGGGSNWADVLVKLMKQDVAADLVGSLISFKGELLAGKLANPQTAMDKCISAANAFQIVYQATDITRGIINVLTMGLADAVPTNATVDLAAFIPETVTLGATALNVATATKTTTGAKVGAIAETTAITVGDVAYSVLTLGIGPLIGFLTGKIVESVEAGWEKDKQVAACFLSAFAATATMVGVGNSIGAQAVQYQVRSWHDVVLVSPKFNALMTRALREYTTRAGPGVISSEDVFQMLEEDLAVISKFKNAADIVSSPFGGVSRTIRQYAVGNDFEKATKYAGTTVVSFLKDCYWREFFEGLNSKAIPLAKAGLISSMVVTGTAPYRNLYTRFGRGLDYDKDGEYKNSYGCKDHECWAFCGLSWTSGEYCFVQSPYTSSRTRLRCSTARDCFDMMESHYRSFKDIPCASTCVLFWHV